MDAAVRQRGPHPPGATGMEESPQRFLVIRLSSLGDIVHALPAVAALGETFPEAEIHWVVESRYADLLAGNPYLRRLIKLDTLGWRKKWLSGKTVEEIIRSVGTLRDCPYEAAIDFQGLWKSALIASLSRSPQRVGFAEYWLREPGAAILYTDRVAPHGRKHVIEMNLALVERLGARASSWRFPLPCGESDGHCVEQRLASLEATEFIVINPGGGWKTKCWAPGNYAQLIRRVSAEIPWKILLTGSPAEENLIHEILRLSGSQQACYFPSSIVEFLALVRRAKLFVGGDTGPLHLAGAVGTPIVAIYGPTDPTRNGPFSSEDITLWNEGRIDYSRSSRHPDYLPGIALESVLAAIRERLKRAYG